MTNTEQLLQDLMIETFKNNVSAFVELLAPELERKGIGKTSKPYLTTKEMCQQAGINYSSWNNSLVKNDARIIAMRDSQSGKANQYASSDVEKIKAIWIEYKNKR